MKLAHIGNRIRRPLMLLGVFVVSLFIAPAASAGYIHFPDMGCTVPLLISFSGKDCIENVVWLKLLLVILYFLSGALLVKLPVFFLLGFKTKKNLLRATVAIIISASLYHLIGMFGGLRLVTGVLLLILLETVFLVFRLKKEMPKEKIIIAVVVANLALYVIKMILGYFNLIPGLPFSY